MSVQEHERCLLSMFFCSICSEQCIKIISSRKKCGLCCSVFKKCIPSCTTHTFQEVGGVPVRSHTFVEIDHEMISTFILLPSADSFKKGC